MYRKDLKLQQHKQMARARAAADRTRKAKSWADQKKGREMLKATAARLQKEHAEKANWQVRFFAKHAREVSKCKIDRAKRDPSKLTEQQRKEKSCEIIQLQNPSHSWRSAEQEKERERLKANAARAKKLQIARAKGEEISKCQADRVRERNKTKKLVSKKKSC
jgi:hypothetical protein